MWKTQVKTEPLDESDALSWCHHDDEDYDSNVNVSHNPSMVQVKQERAENVCCFSDTNLYASTVVIKARDEDPCCISGTTCNKSTIETKQEISKGQCTILNTSCNMLKPQLKQEKNKKLYCIAEVLESTVQNSLPTIDNYDDSNNLLAHSRSDNTQSFVNNVLQKEKDNHHESIKTDHNHAFNRMSEVPLFQERPSIRLVNDLKVEFEEPLQHSQIFTDQHEMETLSEDILLDENYNRGSCDNHKIDAFNDGYKKPVQKPSTSSHQSATLANSETQLSCYVCKRVFKTQFDLDCHLDTDKKKFQCSICFKKYNREYDFERHLKSKHAEQESFECIKCNLKYHEKRLFEEHLKMHKLQELIGSSTRTMPQSESSTNYPCYICKKFFKSEIELGHHLDKDEKVGFQCIFCFERFLLKLDFEQHLQLKHPDEKYFECVPCKVKYLDKGHFIKHLLTHPPNFNVMYGGHELQEQDKSCKRTMEHSDRHDYSCFVCKKVFKSQNDLECHLDKKKKVLFECPFCYKKYGREFDFLRHLKLKHAEAKKL